MKYKIITLEEYNDLIFNYAIQKLEAKKVSVGQKALLSSQMDKEVWKQEGGKEEMIHGKHMMKEREMKKKMKKKKGKRKHK